MSELFLWVKWAHILSATVLFGTGLGTAFHMYATHLRGDVAAIAAMTRNTVLADWLFIATSGVVQVFTGVWMVYLAGYNPLERWLVAAYVLYAVAGIFWVVVVRLQYRMRRFASVAHERGEPLPEEYHRAMKLWFILGWPAFFALIAVFALMVLKPSLS
jgi:uncharacterized membrane protein